MKRFLAVVFVLLGMDLHAQWKRVVQLPASDIYSLYRDNSTLYAGGKQVVYFSKDRGLNWDSTTHVPQLLFIDAIIVYKNELYVSSYGNGIYKSNDFGRTWRNIAIGIRYYISQFTEWKGNLYASTLGDGVFKLDSLRRDRWNGFNQGLSSLSANLYSIKGNASSLVTGALANGIIDTYEDGSGAWIEGYIQNRIVPNEGIYDIVTGRDSFFVAGFESFYLSIDNGLSWSQIAQRMNASTTTLLNAEGSVLMARNYTYPNTITNSLYYYLRKDSLHYAPVLFSNVNNRNTYRMQATGDTLWAAASDGLYFMGISQLPGISSQNDSTKTNDNGHDADDSSKNSVVVGNVYPNPVASIGHLNLLFKKPAELSAAIYDANGKRIHVLSAHQKFNRGQVDLSFTMLNLSGGPYFLTIIVDKHFITRKIIHSNP